MVGITLSAEQIRSAPAEVRQWIEHEIATSLGLEVQPDGSRSDGGQLIPCSHEEVAGVLSLIQGVFPAVNVFFELGRQGASLGQEQVEVYRLADLQHHTRLQSTEQVMSCLTFIDEALHRVRGSADGSLYVLNADYCIIAAQTQHNIRRLWLELLGRGLVGAQPSAGAPSGQARASTVPDGSSSPAMAPQQSLQG